MSPNKIDRVRGWILVQAEPAQEVAQVLYDKLGQEGGDRFVVVRANVVVHSSFNLIVPVDAESRDALDEVSAMIKDLAGVRETQVVAIVPRGQVPSPPHNAQGFITQEEWDKGRDKTADVGRFGQSPGFNAWG